MTNTEADDKAAAVAEQGAPVAPEKAASKKAATQKKGAPKGQKPAKGAKTKPEAKAKKAAKKTERKAAASRSETKGAKILEMIGRAKGATLAEIMNATGWQAHSVRGFISTAGKKHKFEIESSKNEAGDRLYCIAK